MKKLLHSVTLSLCHKITEWKHEVSKPSIKSINARVGIWKDSIGDLLKFYWGFSKIPLGTCNTSIGDLVNFHWGLTEPLARRKSTAPLNLTSCRALAVSMPSARYRNAERSPCKRWGLAFSVKSKEKFSLTNGKIGIRRTKASVNPHIRIGVGKDLMNDFYVLCMVLLVRGEFFC